MINTTENKYKILVHQMENEKVFWSNLIKDLVENHRTRIDDSEIGLIKTFDVDFNNDIRAKVDGLCKKNENIFMILANTIISIFFKVYLNEKIVALDYLLDNKKYKNNIGSHIIFSSTVEKNISTRELLNANIDRLKKCLENANYPIDILAADYIGKGLSLEDYVDARVLINGREPIQKSGLLTFDFKYDKSLELAIYYEDEQYTLDEINYITSLFNSVWSTCLNNIDLSIQEVIDKISNHAEMMKMLNDTNHAFDSELTLIDIFERSVEKNPNAIAIKGNDFALTYEEFNNKVNSLAHSLRSEGIEADDIVGMMVPRSAEMMIGIYAILKAGGAYMPIDAEYPQRRIDYILENSKCKVVLTLRKFSDKFPSDKNIIFIDDEGAYSNKTSNLEHVNSPSDLAYIIYTSGTTGNPKGVMIEHRSAINRIEWMQSEYSISNKDVIMQKTPYTFDVSVWEIFWWMFEGASVFLLPLGGEKNPIEIVEAIKNQGITTMHFVPSMLNAFINYIAEVDASGLDSLKKVFASGEELQVHQVNKFNELLGTTTKLINLYGPTEAAVDVTHYPCFLKKKYNKVYIGKPVYNTRIYIVDNNNNPLEIGCEGELCIAGVQLARGYVNNKELTAEKFIDNPFDGESRIYKTGDLARFTEQGDIEYLGRIDSQVKIRGFRIEIGEIVSSLRKSEKIKDAVVFARKDQLNNKYLCAYIIKRDDKIEITRKNLVSYLEKMIPSYMVPEKFYLIDEFPLSPNGKLDYKNFPTEGEIKEETKYVKPINEKEELMISIWEQVLNIDNIGACDDFFSLGGNSIHFISVLAKLKSNGYVFSFQDLYNYSTVRELCEHIERFTVEEEKDTAFSLLKEEDKIKAEAMENVDDIYPLSYLQAGLIYQGEVNKGSSHYHDIITQKIGGKFNETAFRKAVSEMVRLHPIFRTAYDLVNFSEYVQIVYHDVDDVVVIEDLTDLSVEQQNNRLEEYLADERNNQFQWDKGGLIRIHIQVLNDKEYYYHLSFSDTALDGWSINLIHSQLFKIYYEIMAGTYIADNDEIDNHLRTYIKLEKEIIKSEEAKDYWVNILEDTPRIEIPRLRKEKGKNEIIFFDVDITDDLSQKIISLSEELGIPVKNILMAAHIKVLSALSNERCVVTGYEHSGRPEVLGADHSIGLFLNTIPFRIDLEEGTWLDLIEQVYKREGDLLSYRRYPMAVMKSDINNYSSNIFEVVFNFTHFYVLKELKKLDDFKLLDVRASAETEFCFRAEFCQNYFTDKVGLSIHYYANLFDEDQISNIGTYYVNVLNMMVSDVNSMHDSHTVCSKKEISILNSFEGQHFDLPENSTFLDYYDSVLEQNADKIALECGNEKITYDELNKRVNCFANELLTNGVSKQTAVAVMLDRSIEWAVAVLALWKIGAIYIPVDAEVPIHRFESIISKSNCNTVVYSKGKNINNEVFKNDNVKFLCYEDLNNNSCKEIIIENQASSDDTAYIIFTSGTTGEPKGAIVKHKGMLNHLMAKRIDLDLKSDDVIAQNANKSFDISIWQLVEALFVGATTVIIPNDKVISIDSFINILIDKKISVLEMVPSYLEVMIDYCSNIDIRLNYLRLLIVTGEQFKKNLAERWFALYPAISMVNAYGPTEASDDITHYILNEVPDTNSILVGKPIINTKIDIRDAYNNVVPIGAPGQLFVSGIAVGGGYVGNPEQTEKVFSESIIDGVIERTYATGDIGRFLPDGNIELYGRVDDQVKVRGFRIELDEIENNILKVGNIIQVAVLINKTNNGNELIAFIKRDGDIDGEEINKKLSTLMPYYMIPSRYIFVDELPITNNGKLDKKKLLNSIPNIESKAKVVVEPKTDNEIKLVEIIKEILDADIISMNDNFFEIGGNSLLVMKLVMRLDSKLSVASIINNPIISNMAKLLSEDNKEEGYLIPYRNNEFTDNIFIGIPYAGGNALAFNETFDILSEKSKDISMFTLNMDKEETIEELLVGAVEEISKNCGMNTTISIWGHCSGSAMALELSRLLTIANLKTKMVFIGGKLLKNSQAYIDSNDELVKMSDKEIKEWLIEQTKFEGFDNSENDVIKRIISHFKRDSYWCNEYLKTISDKEFNNVPITTIYSNDDRLTKDYHEKYINWNKITDTLSFYSINKNKGHYFISTAADDVSEIIKKTI